jgi:hypothetical protein
MLVGEHLCLVPRQTPSSPVERVRDAIRRGARTQRAIRQKTRLGPDEIGLALAELMLWTREVTTRFVGESRHYVINDPQVLPLRDTEGLDLPSRKPDVLASASQPAEVASERKVS